MMLRLPDRLLVVVSHPDDEVLGCGGLISRVTSGSGHARILILTEGATTQYPNRRDLVAQKEGEAQAAAEILGAEQVVFAGLPDMRLTTLPMADIAAPIAQMVDAFRPDCIATHHRSDLNSDHRVTHEACRVAARPNDVKAPTLLAMEVPSSSEYAFEPIRPNLAVQLSGEDLARKQQALAAYSSEAREYPHGRSSEALAALAAFRGYSSRTMRSEAFEIVWGQIR